MLETTSPAIETIEPGRFGFPDLRWTEGEFQALGFEQPVGEDVGYDGKETISAGYIVNTAQLTDNLSTLIGVRVEGTSHEYMGLSGDETLDNDGDYVTYRGKNGVQLRAAFSSGLSRPEYTTLIPFESVSTGDEEVFISRGNPDLDPTTARSFDLMGEWYTNRLGFVSVGVLYCAHSNYPAVPMASSIEMFDPETLEHVGSHSVGIMHGSATWIDRREGQWWVGFAHYEGRGGIPDRGPAWTRIMSFDDVWRVVGGYTFPWPVTGRLHVFAYVFLPTCFCYMFLKRRFVTEGLTVSSSNSSSGSSSSISAICRSFSIS